jgi:hypothetical protein
VTIGKAILGEMRLCSSFTSRFSDRLLANYLEEVIGEVRRIPLPRNPVNNLFGECAGLGSLASSLLAGKGYGKDVL